MINGPLPDYLNNLIPPTVGSSSTNNLRRPNNLRTIACRTSLYSNSFLPAVIHDWNNLPDEIKNHCHPLTHYQTTNFRLFQTERVCRRQFQI